jgi:hypothetical protein
VGPGRSVGCWVQPSIFLSFLFVLLQPVCLLACLPAYLPACLLACLLLLILFCFDQLDVCTLDTIQLSSCTCICFPVTTTELLIAGVQRGSADSLPPPPPRLCSPPPPTLTLLLLLLSQLHFPFPNCGSLLSPAS